MSQGNKYRAQILLEPEQHQQLSEIAAREGRSVSDVVREAVAAYVVTRSQEDIRKKRLKALDEIKRFRQAVLERRGGKPIEGDVVALIDQMREERDHDLLTRIGSAPNDRD